MIIDIFNRASAGQSSHKTYIDVDECGEAIPQKEISHVVTLIAIAFEDRCSDGMQQQTESKCPSNRAEIGIDQFIKLKAHAERSISYNTYESSQYKNTVEEHEVNCYFEELHQKLNVPSPNQRRSKNDRDEGSVLRRVLLKGDLACLGRLISI